MLKFQDLTADGKYGPLTEAAVEAFQRGNNMSATGVFDASTASLLLSKHLKDGYKDDGTIPPGYLYKVYVPVYSNRSIETYGKLYDANMTLLHTFRARTHGQNDPQTGQALNQLVRLPFALYG